MGSEPTVDRGVAIKMCIDKIERDPKSISLRTSLGSQIADFERELQKELDYLKVIKKRFDIVSK